MGEKCHTPASGASVERGKIAEIAAEGYRVENLDRRGIVTCVISCVDNSLYNVGDMVYFFMFRDGTGKILCRA